MLFTHRVNDKRRMDDSERTPLREITEKHRNIARLVSLGMTNERIAQEVGCTSQTVSNVRNDLSIRAHIEDWQAQEDVKVKNIMDRVYQSLPKAVDVLEDILSGNIPANASTQRKTAVDVLSMAGMGPIKNQRSLSIHGHLNMSTIAQIKSRAKELNESSNRDK